MASLEVPPVDGGGSAGVPAGPSGAELAYPGGSLRLVSAPPPNPSLLTAGLGRLMDILPVSTEPVF